MNRLRLSVFLITALICCSLIPAGIAADPAFPQTPGIFPDTGWNLRAQPDACSNCNNCSNCICCGIVLAVRNYVIDGPGTFDCSHTVDPGAKRLEISLHWDNPQEHNPLKLQLTAPNGETYGPYNDLHRTGNIHRELTSPMLPSGKWLISVTQTAAETTPFVLTIQP